MTSARRNKSGCRVIAATNFVVFARVRGGMYGRENAIWAPLVWHELQRIQL